MRKKEIKLNPADLIMITDGECGLKDKELEEILTLKKDTQVRIQSIGIGNEVDPEGSLKDFSNGITLINSFGEVNSIKKMVASVATLKR